MLPHLFGDSEVILGEEDASQAGEAGLVAFLLVDDQLQLQDVHDTGPQTLNFVGEEILTSPGGGQRWEEHDSLPRPAIEFQDFSLQLLDCEVDEESGVASLHLGNDPVLPFFVTHRRPP